MRSSLFLSLFVALFWSHKAHTHLHTNGMPPLWKMFLLSPQGHIHTHLLIKEPSGLLEVRILPLHTCRFEPVITPATFWEMDNLFHLLSHSSDWFYHTFWMYCWYHTPTPDRAQTYQPLCVYLPSNLFLNCCVTNQPVTTLLQRESWKCLVMLFRESDILH